MMRRTDLAFVILVISAVLLALPDNAMASPAPPEGQGIWTQGTVTSTPYAVKKGDPVAVVYYRCELNKAKECTPHEGFYYVHNGVALEDLPTAKGEAHVSHVGRWNNQTPVVDSLYICGAEAAAQVSEAGHHCHGDRDNPNDSKSPWKAWVVKAIYTYSVGQPNSYSVGPPITWMLDNKEKEPHNGAFKCFQKQSSKDCDPVITKSAQGTLEYWHYVNATPITSDGEDGRTAKRWEKFTLQSGWAPEKGSVGAIAIEIVKSQ